MLEKREEDDMDICEVWNVNARRFWLLMLLLFLSAAADSKGEEGIVEKVMLPKSGIMLTFGKSYRVSRNATVDSEILRVKDLSGGEFFVLEQLFITDLVAYVRILSGNPRAQAKVMEITAKGIPIYEFTAEDGQCHFILAVNPIEKEPEKQLFPYMDIACGADRRAQVLEIARKVEQLKVGERISFMGKKV
jgi:hypothetical protein